MTPISAQALEVAEGELALGIRGGGSAMWAKFRGLRVDEYQRSVGLPVSPDPKVQGFPWCASAVFWCFQQAADSLQLFNPCPRTPGALKLWDAAQDAHGTHSPAPGDVFVLDRGGGHGHVGFVQQVAANGVLTTVEPDTSNSTMSATGDAWGVHTWDPAEGKRGVLVGYLAF